MVLDYRKLVTTISTEKREILSKKLVDLILTSKNDDRMPNQLANAMLYHWQHDALKSESGIAVLLEAVLLLEPEKTFNALEELQMTDIARQVKEAIEG